MSNVQPALPVLPPGWRWSRLDELAAPVPNAITDGPFGSNLKTEHYTPAGPRVIRLQNVGDGEFIDASAHVSTERFELLRRHEVVAGDVVIAALGEILPRACVVPNSVGPAIVKADCPRIRPHPEVDSRYLTAALNSALVRDQAAAIIAGVGRPRLNLSKVKGLLIPTPPAAEQRRIAERLEQLVGLCAFGLSELDQAATRSTLFLSAIIRDTFARANHSGTSPLNTVADIRSGLTKGRRTKDETREHPFLRAANVRQGELDLAVIKTIPATDAEAGRFKLIRGDVLMVEGSGSAHRLGQGWVWDEQVEGCLHQNHVFRARPDQLKLRPEYLAWFLQSQQARRYFAANAKTTSGLSTINRTQVGGLPVPLPPLDEQDRVVNDLTAAMARVQQIRSAVEAERNRGETLRRSIFVFACSGRLHTGDPTDEPAEALIVRIADEARAAAKPTGAKKRRAAAGAG